MLITCGKIKEGGESMKKQYSLDFSIVRDEARVAAVQEILDKMETDPN
jgi:hypothetical protein